MANLSGDNSGSQASGNDPRLKAYLRQARGIIAAEKGLNAKSRIKLQSLAIQIQLPDELFQLALDQLKLTKSLSEVDHWEKSFVEFLESEFEKLPNRILTIATESRAVDLAKRKYQIDETRTRQLIDELAEKHGLGRVAADEARRYAEQLILGRVEKLTIARESLRKQLYQTGSTWGLDQGEVDALVLQRLVQNRGEMRARRRRRWLATIFAITTIGSLVVVATHFDWWTDAYTWIMAKPAPTRIKLEELPSPDAENFAAAWWDADLRDAFANLQANPAIKSTVNKMTSPDLDIRVEGFIEFAELACRIPNTDRQTMVDLFADTFFREPEIRVATDALAQILGRLAPPDNRFPTMADLKFTYRLQSLLNRLWFQTLEKSNEDRLFAAKHKVVSEAIFTNFGIRADTLSHDELQKRTEAVLAQDQWDYIVRNCWKSPARAVVLVQPLYELTLPKMDRTLVNQLRVRAIEAILEIDERRWKDMRSALEDAVAASDEVGTHDWIEICQASKTSEFKDFLGKCLIKKTGTSPEKNQSFTVAQALENERIKYLTQRLQPWVTRNKLAEDYSTQSTGIGGIPPTEISPQSIANLAFAANASLTIANALKNGQGSLDRFDDWTGGGLPDLNALFPLETHDQGKGGRMTTGASVSEDRSKREAIAIIRDYDSSFTMTRRSALEQLARIARRFDQISYAEAAILADYLLSEMPLEEWLNVEKNISAFAHWSNLGLALADRLPDSTVEFEQATTLFSLIFRRNTSFEASTDWRLPVQQEIYRLVSDELNATAQRNPEQTLSWERLSLYLATAYAFRNRQLVDDVTNQDNPRSKSTSEWATANAECIVESNDPAMPKNLQRSMLLIEKSMFSDLETTVLANQTLAAGVANQISVEFPNRKWDVEEVMQKYQKWTSSPTAMGRRLYLTEWTLLSLWDIRRNELIKREFESKTR